jgi:beta-glucosidase
MKRITLISFLFGVLYTFGQNGQQIKTPKLSVTTIKQIIATMSLDEKVKLVVGAGMPIENDGPIVPDDVASRVPGSDGGSMHFPEYGIPGTVMADGPAGLRIDPFRGNERNKSYYATAWPVGTLLASSWDINLVKKVGTAFGNEVKEYGVDFILGPGMNIQRDPLCGRNFEYYSEDPLVTGLIGASMVKGIQSNGVATSIKHFAANNQENNRNSVNVNVSERALREIYLKGFEIAVKEANPLTVMSSYNKINGTYTSESYDLLTTILRKEWGFKNFVITDWYGGKDPIAQMKAGNDLIMPGSPGKSAKILEAIKNGSLDVKIIDQNAERILKGLLQIPSFLNYKYSNNPDLTAHAAISRAAATEGMVLLKNNNAVLPLRKGIKAVLYGNASYETISGGLGSGDVYEKYCISILNGLKNSGFKVIEELTPKYLTYIQQDKATHPMPKVTMGAIRMMPEMDITLDDIRETATAADVAIYTIGRNSSEGGDRKVENDFNLTTTEKSYLKNISEIFHAAGKKLVVIINSGGIIETASWRDCADAILLAWQPGQEAGNAIADVISGAVTPSGKLAVTFPMKYEDEPAANKIQGTTTNSPKEVTYEEGIYVGYRYFNSFKVKPAYEFGYGLSYTQFAFSNLKLSSSSFKDKITVTLTVTNTGKVPGKEVVQLYLSAPTTSLDKPAEELKGFAKTRLLKSSESQTIAFTLNPKDLASFNTAQSAWVADAGNYTVKIGASSEDIKLTKSFTLGKEILVEKVNRVLIPQVPVDELKANKDYKLDSKE